MPRTKDQHQEYVRQWRKNTQEERKFDKGLREFMKIKYRDQYNEYFHFFEMINEHYPTAKDVTKTKTFKKWKTSQLNCEDIKEETAEIPVQAEIPPPEDMELPVQAEIPPPEDIELPVQDYQDAAVREVGNVEINQADDQIQQIINELEQDEALRGVLNQVQGADEGIALDVEVELQEIIEPFDFELEAQDVDFF